MNDHPIVSTKILKSMFAKRPYYDEPWSPWTEKQASLRPQLMRKEKKGNRDKVFDL